MSNEQPSAPAGIPGSMLPGPFPVGEYASALRGKLRSLARVQLVGELSGVRAARARVYFELRDDSGAVPCAAWRGDWEQIERRCGELAQGMEVVVAGGCDYYPGTATASPAFSFSVSDLRIAGEGDLLARIERLRRVLRAEGLLELQRALKRPLLPRSIGVVTGEGGKARDDILAGLHRRGWGGRLVWGFAPVQDRHAAPAITRAVQDLAGLAAVDLVIVARGGGSLADLMCFCDETLCRTVAMLAVPVIASVGHHTDRTLLDDVAAVSCSTPTHAAEVAVGIDCNEARRRIHGEARRLRDHARRAILARARALAALSRAPAEHLARERARLHQELREIRAAGRRRLRAEGLQTGARATALDRRARAGILECERRGPAELRRLAMALSAHDPQRTLQRGYVLVRDPAGDPLTSAAAARAAQELRLSFADGVLPAKVEQE